MRIVVSGKGGSGKTTIAGTLARILARMGQPVLAIDGDSNPNLAITLGLPKEVALRIEPVPGNLLQEIEDTAGNKSSSLALSTGQIVENYGVDARDGVRLLVTGKVDHAGTG